MKKLIIILAVVIAVPAIGYAAVGSTDAPDEIAIYDANVNAQQIALSKVIVDLNSPACLSLEDGALDAKINAHDRLSKLVASSLQANYEVLCKRLR